MIKKIVPLLLLTLVLLAGCSSRASDHDGARAPAARPESLTATSGETIHPGRISQTVQIRLHPDGRVSILAEFAGTEHFKDWMNEQYDFLESAMGGRLDRFEEGGQARFSRTIEFGSVAELNESGMMSLNLSRSPFVYGLAWKTQTSSYSADTLAAVFTQPAANLVADEAWGDYLLDVYHLKYLVTDERTGAQYTWERSAREIGSGQTVSFVARAWRPLAWVLLGLTGAILAFVIWAGLFGERIWAPRVEEA
ncbi:MAG TPA: hypothetical protein VK191_05600 [Symbiobacteriaceae bacterium]|nr:hypothetical protein [Symbiobacteriaceae bacterium]